MSLVIAENINHAYGALEVLKDVSFRLAESNRVGLVGPNGEGKTTMMRIIAGLIEPTSGGVHRSGSLKFGYLPQDPPALEGDTIHDLMLEVFADVRQLERQLHDHAGDLTDGDEEALERYGQMQTRFEMLGGYGYDTRIEQVLTGLGFAEEMWSQRLDELSGGQRSRAYLASLLLKEPNLLMLDEPTNHLDLDSVEWLETWLRSFGGALVVVSHDRYFLDRTTTETWEIAFTKLETYRGSYSQYLPKRDERHKERLRLWQAQQEYIGKTQEFVRIHLAGQRTREAQGRRRRLERFMRDEAVDRPSEHRQISLNLFARKRSGDLVLRAEDLKVGYQEGAELVSCESIELLRGQRVVIVGPNGAGKTTLLRTLLGELDPLAGSAKYGANVEVGYLSQTHAELGEETTAIEAVRASLIGCSLEHAHDLLGALLLSGDVAHKRISQLSGGQRSRVALARLAASRAGLLMLDEPTNHLDIPSTEIIQDVLRKFDGTVLFVTHDRYLIQSVATHIWAIDGGTIRVILGGWEDYVKWRSARRLQSAQDGDAKAKTQRKADYRESRKKSNLLQRLQRRHEELEILIDKAESELAVLSDEISAAGQSGDIARVEKLGNDYPKVKAKLDELWREWEQVGQELE